MNKKLQVFISSTFTDLKEERQAAIKAILDAGHIPAGMELFKAGKSQMETIRRWIDDSDVYMLILGGCYGSIEKDSGLSYTELEYQYALSKKMPVFAIVLEDTYLHQKAANGEANVFEKYNADKYDTFKKLVKTNIVRFSDNKDQILSNIHSQLNSLINDDNYNLVGWTRNVINEKTSDTLFHVMLKTLAHIELPDHNYALSFFLSHYYECHEDHWYSDKDEICTSYMFLEELNLVKHTRYSGSDRPDCYGKLIKFNITQNGIDFYKYVKSKNAELKS